MVSISGSLSFAKLVMMSSAPAKSAGDARYASQDSFVHLFIDRLSHKISNDSKRSQGCVLSTSKAIINTKFLELRKNTSELGIINKIFYRECNVPQLSALESAVPR